MPKELVILCDGTQDAPETSHTNVLLLRYALQKTNALDSVPKAYDGGTEGWAVDVYRSAGEITRLVYYERGLGAPKVFPKSADNQTGGNWSAGFLHAFEKMNTTLENRFTDEIKKIGGEVQSLKEAVTAIGIIDNIKQAYYFLADHYEPGDKIFLFGFSRGAYTLRLLVTMLRYIGLIDKSKLASGENLHAAMERGFSLYSSDIHPDLNQNSVAFRKTSYSYEKLVHFLGLWETVPGLVLENIRSDGKLSSVVETARHALSIDEKRALFKPELWIKSDCTDSKQMWFSGVHSDVGGGYKDGDHHLSNVALYWMVGEAQACGLNVNQDMLDAAVKFTFGIENVQDLGVQHDSLSEAVSSGLAITWQAGGTYDRPIAQTVIDECLHSSVIERYGRKVQTLRGQLAPDLNKYWPLNLTHALITFKIALNNDQADTAASLDKLNEVAIPDLRVLAGYDPSTNLVPPSEWSFSNL